VIKNNDAVVSEKVLDNTNAYLAAYITILFVSFALISVDEYSVATNFTAVLSCFNNMGPGFEAVGPTCNYAGYSIFSKLVLCLDMLLGRLEIFPILVLFSPSTWKH
jgi:trk system potassium uptake protein TrkH